jgi:hypothetical protein
MSKRPTSKDTRSVTSSPGSGGGAMPCDLPDGQMTLLSGLDPVHVSPSALPAKAKASQTSDISGPSSDASSRSASLQSSLESRLRQRLEGRGSPEYVLKWKHWDMDSGPPICALRASTPRTSAKGSSGWPTPLQSDHSRSEMCRLKKDRQSRDPSKPGSYRHELPDVAKMAGWPTPMAGTPAQKGYNEAGNTDSSRKTTALVAGWPTPSAQGSAGEVSEDLERIGNKWRNKKTGRILQTNLATDAKMLCAGWATPTSRDHKDGASTLENTPINGLLGRQVSLSPAQTEKRGALNPAFSLWLMGFPAEWVSCGARAMRLCRKSRKRS